MRQIEALVNTEPTKDRKETILVVDDDEIVLDYAASLLTGANYHVMAAHGPGRAAYLAEDYSRTIDLLLTDYQMPDVDGVELADGLTKGRPNLRVLVMSGRDRDEITLPENARFIQKPFASAALLDLVAEILSTAAELPEKVPVQREPGKSSSEARKVGRA